MTAQCPAVIEFRADDDVGQPERRRVGRRERGQRTGRQATCGRCPVGERRGQRGWRAGEAEIRRSQCLPGKLMPEHVAAMVLFLAADDSKMCTGQDFVVDAGWT